MLSSGSAKTVLGRRALQRFLACGLCLGLVITVLLLVRTHTSPPVKTVTIGSQAYRLAVADTPKAQAKGLGGQQTLAPGEEGMLFAYKQPSILCFWMKDMHFPIDMLWVSASRRVVHVQLGVAPTSYPKAFCGPQPAQYVIELSAGQAAQAKLQVGDCVSF